MGCGARLQDHADRKQGPNSRPAPAGAHLTHPYCQEVPGGQIRGRGAASAGAAQTTPIAAAQVTARKTNDFVFMAHSLRAGTLVRVASSRLSKFRWRDDPP